MKPLKGILADIVARKSQRLQEVKQRFPMRQMERMSLSVEPPRGLRESLARHGPVAIIAEIKRASPSGGEFLPGLRPIDLAIEYERGGAAAISVLTEEHFFSGCPDDLSKVRSHTALPVLRKDFIFEPYQIFESRAMGADAVLLIARCLSDVEMGHLLGLALEVGMDALVEVRDEDEARAVSDIGAGIIGINNRNLESFKIDLATTEEVAPHIPKDRLVVSESGIATRQDVLRVGLAGARAVLVGNALVQASGTGRAGAKIRELMGKCSEGVGPTCASL